MSDYMAYLASINSITIYRRPWYLELYGLKNNCWVGPREHSCIRYMSEPKTSGTSMTLSCRLSEHKFLCPTGADGKPYFRKGTKRNIDQTQRP